MLINYIDVSTHVSWQLSLILCFDCVFFNDVKQENDISLQTGSDKRFKE